MNDLATPVDPDRTVLPDEAGRRVPPVGDPVDGLALPRGTRLEEFEITGLVGRGGFGIVYRAHDHSLGRTVALKEYLPVQIATRTGTGSITVVASHFTEAFATGRRSFVNEARTLASFDHPSLVRVHRFWEANGTAYMVMPLVEGPTLRQWLERHPPPDEPWLNRVLVQLLAALGRMHADDCYHRDVAPDNIIIGAGGRPVLLDFGAARHVVADVTQAPTVIVKPGFAPWEQYAMSDDLRQGPWTDLYALAATAYFAILGTAPPPAITRVARDPFEPLARMAQGRYSAGFLEALDRALALMPADRPQSAAQMSAMLEARIPGAEDGPASPAGPHVVDESTQRPATSPIRGRSILAGIVGTITRQVPLTALRLAVAALLLYLLAVAVEFTIEVVADAPPSHHRAPAVDNVGPASPEINRAR